MAARRTKPYYTHLLSARNHATPSLKRRRNVIFIQNSAERHPLHSFVCMVGVGDTGALVLASNDGNRNFHSPSWHRASSKALSSCCGHNIRNSTKSILPSSPSFSCARYMMSSHHDVQRPGHHPSTIANLEFRVSELENSSQHRLTQNDLQHQIWPLLLECSPPLSFGQHNNYTEALEKGHTQQERLDRAKLCSRVLELCLKEVEARRVFLWEWLQQQDLDENNSNNSGSDDATNNFSPTAFWNETPHPPQEMFTLVITAWKNVIESCSSFSIKSTAAMELMESSAQQASSLLSLLEEEHSSDAAFVHAYNSQVDKGRYTLIQSAAALPDVKSYSDVIGTWGQCIDGSGLRQPERTRGNNHHPNSSDRDGAFQKRLQLEATATKAMMKLLESMEGDYYGIFSEEPSTTNENSQRKRPPPDRVCYNIILASMARQINPSLYEMRLVTQRMMERVKYELEHPDNITDLEEEGHEGDDDDHCHEYAMTFFPDVFSYNALIDARANRSAMFASDDITKQQQQQRSQQFSSSPPRFQRHSAWQQEQSENLPMRKRRFSSSEEEVLLGEQILYEMSHIVTASVRPNIYSYNAVIKGWVKSGSERGLQRAVMILRALALNGHNKMNKRNKEMDGAPTNSGVNTKEEVPTVFQRIARWGSSLLGKDNAKLGNEENADNGRPSFAAEPRGNAQMERANKPSSLDGREPSTNPISPPPSGIQHEPLLRIVSRTSRGGKPNSTSVPASARVQCVMHVSPAVVGWVIGKGGAAIRNMMKESGANIWIDQESMGAKEARILHIGGKRSSVDSAVRMVQDLVAKSPVAASAATSTGVVPAPAVSIGMASRMAFAFQGNGQRGNLQQNTQPRMGRINSAARDNGQEMVSISKNDDVNRQRERPEPIGRLPTIEPHVTPDLKTFMIVINALARRGTVMSAEMADDLLHLLEEYYSDLNLDIKIYHSVLNAWARAAKETSDVSSSSASALKADELLCRLLGRVQSDRLLEADQEEKYIFPQANEYSFLMAINAWANASSTAVSAEKIADGTVSANHAEKLLKGLQTLALKPNKTTIACYGAVIRTWASLGQAERAQKVLEEMVENSGHLPLDLIHFNAVLDAWARDLSSTKSLDEILPKVSSIRGLLMKMDGGRSHQSYNVDPDNGSYNHVIRACYAPWASSQSHGDESIRRQALEMAYETYSKMSQDYNSSHRPDAHTYQHMFKAIACLLPSSANTDPDEKHSLCKAIFQACCRDGHLAKSSIWVLRKTLPADEFAELLISEMDHHDINKEKLLSIPEDTLYRYLPAEWSRKGRRHEALSKHTD
ncbi:hypothetical protein ACHAXR_011822 [Thalassiosira sp. AJA248-18]